MAGETFCHSQGAENAKNKAEGTTTRKPVAMLIGLSRELRNRPPKQKRVLPTKYSQFLPRLALGNSFFTSIGPGDEPADESRS